MKYKIESLSQKLDTAAKNAEPIAQLSLEYRLTLEEAYDIQKESLGLRYARGQKLTGLKLGFTSRAKMEQMGVHDLIWGRLTDKMQFNDKGFLDLKEFIHPRAEPEIAFLLKKDIQDVVGIDDVLEYVDGVAAAIEIIDSRYENFKFSLEDVIADNCSSSGYVLGEWKPADISLADLSIEMKLNGNVAENGNSKAILGNPVASLAEAVRLAHRYGVSLKKGMVVLAGAATPAIYMNTGDVITVTVEKLGTVGLNVK